MHEGLNPKEATITAMKDISGAIIAITLVMSAVFIPVAFMPGTTGIFYKQFSLTLAIAIVISGVNALTLTPALCAILLKKEADQRKSILNRYGNWFNKKYGGIEKSYTQLIRAVVTRPLLVLSILLIVCAAAWLSSHILSSGFIPVEDQGVIYVNVTAPRGATLERTSKVLDQVQSIARELDAVESTSTLAGYSLVNDVPGASYGMGMISLAHWDNRTASTNDVIKLLTERSNSIKDAKLQFFSPPTVPGFGNSSGFELRLIDRTGSNNLQKLASVSNDFIEVLNNSEKISNGYTSYDASFPQYRIHVDKEIAASKGVTVETAMFNLQTLFGSYYTSNFIRFGQMYKVMMQAAPEYRVEPKMLEDLYVKNNDNEMVPYSNFIRLERIYGPEQITRYNMYNSAMINGDAQPGFSSADVVEEVELKAKENLPKGYTYEWTGITREQIATGNQSIFIFLISLLFIYLILAAQYESFLLPLPVIL
jgi:HAE1 family hydrophobic/amphiphilic exporter-1